MDPTTIATITANGQTYTAWESVMVRRDWGKGISIFQFAPAEGSYGPGFSAMQLKPFDKVTITLGGVLVITGSVTTRIVAYDDRSHSLIIAGKSKTQDLLSSVPVQPGSLNGNTFRQAAMMALQPHGVGLTMLNPPPIASKPFANLAIQYGESVAEFLTRMGNQRGLMFCDSPQGDFVAGAAAPGSATATLQEGVNIKRATAKLDNQTAWGSMAGTTQQPGTDQNWPSRAIAATGTDPSVPSNRLKLLISDHPGDAQDLAQRVNHEMLASQWPCVECSVTVQGWFQPNGQLWQCLEYVAIQSPMIFPTASGNVVLVTCPRKVHPV